VRARRPARSWSSRTQQSGGAATFVNSVLIVNATTGSVV
jgi:hypothetical protein